MKTIQFRDGEKVAALGQGTWSMGDDNNNRADEIASLQKGIDLGMNLVDTAEMYGNGRSELLVGEAIKGRRENVFLVTKVLPTHASYRGTIKACEESLKRLNTDYIDLYLLHWQSLYPIEETLEAFLTLQTMGKIKRWGVSNFDVDVIQELVSLPNGSDCSTNQILYNLTRRGVEYDLLPWSESVGMPLMAYSPVEQGRLLNSEGLKKIAANHHASTAQIALAWVLHHHNVIPIPKASRVEHVKDNFKSLSIELTQEDYALLNDLFPPPHQKIPLEVI